MPAYQMNAGMQDPRLEQHTIHSPTHQSIHSPTEPSIRRPSACPPTRLVCIGLKLGDHIP